MRIKNGILAIALGTLVSAGGLVAGCSDAAPAKTDGGTTPTGTTTTTTTTTTTAPTGTSTGTTPTTSLYDRLGKLTGIRAVVKAIVVEELKNENVKSYFFFQLSPGGAKPSADDIEECLANQLAAAAGGPEKYPLTLAGGYACRGDMKAIHDKLHIPGATFDKFIEIAGGVLTANKVASDDIKTVAGVLVGTKGQVVDPAAPAGDFIKPADAGGGG